MTAEQLTLVVFHDPRGRRIHVREAAGGIAVINEVLRVLDDVPQARLGCLERLLQRIRRHHCGCAVDPGDGRRYRSYQATIRVIRSSRCFSSRRPCGSRG